MRRLIPGTAQFLPESGLARRLDLLALRHPSGTRARISRVSSSQGIFWRLPPRWIAWFASRDAKANVKPSRPVGRRNSIDIREANCCEIKTLAGRRQCLNPDFPSAEALFRLRERPNVLMPVALVEAEVIGFALASLTTEHERRLGIVRYVLAFVDGGPVADAIQVALLARLERQFAALETDEIQLGADQPTILTDYLDRMGYRVYALGVEDAPSTDSRGQVFKYLKPVLSRTRTGARHPQG